MIDYGGMTNLYLGEWLNPQTQRSVSFSISSFIFLSQLAQITVALKNFRELQIGRETPQTEQMKKVGFCNPFPLVSSICDAFLLTQRLVKETRVWIDLHHSNILPYLGHCLCQDIGPWPSLASPYRRNGTVMTYLATYPDADRMALVIPSSLISCAP
jgi:hypothetical protein